MLKRVVLVVAVLIAAASGSAEAKIGVSCLKGSPAALAKQNNEADRERLTRLSEDELSSFKRSGLLVHLPSGAVTVDERLPEKYRWCRPWTREFLVDLGRNFEREFGKPLQVNSAVRTIERQAELTRCNGNAARGREKNRRSSHLTGATVDIAKRGLSREQIAWMRQRLSINERLGFIEATEEFCQPVFHVMVFKKYRQTKKAKRTAPRKRRR